MSILDELFEGDEFDAHQVLSDELVAQTLGIVPALVAIWEKKGLSQEDVAKRMGISRPGVAQLERRDSNPTLSTLRRYALAMDALITVDVCDGQPWADNRVRIAQDPDLYDKTLHKWSNPGTASGASRRSEGSYRSTAPGKYVRHVRPMASKVGA